MKLIKSELTILAFSANSVSTGSELRCVHLAGGSSSDERSVSIFRYARESHVVEVIHFMFLLTLLPRQPLSSSAPRLSKRLFLTGSASILLHR